MLIKVNKKVPEEFDSVGKHKQVPAPTCMLTRKLTLMSETLMNSSRSLGCTNEF